MKEYRIYVDGKLVNVYHSDFVLMNNYSNYKKEYGDRVELKTLDKTTNDEEKREWLESLNTR